MNTQCSRPFSSPRSTYSSASCTSFFAALRCAMHRIGTLAKSTHVAVRKSGYTSKLWSVLVIQFWHFGIWWILTPTFWLRNPNQTDPCWCHNPLDLICSRIRRPKRDKEKDLKERNSKSIMLRTMSDAWRFPKNAGTPKSSKLCRPF